MHICGRPLSENEPIPRSNLIALNKLSAEANLTKSKTILGWNLDFRQLRIALSKNKHITWSEAITKMINDKQTTAKELESNIGRLGHLAVILPFVNHFMSRLRDLNARVKKKRTITISKTCLDNLALMQFFLDTAHQGVSFNTITYHQPTHLYRSDSCPHGLGGYNHNGYSWGWKVPDDLLFRASNNLLEHLASIFDHNTMDRHHLRTIVRRGLRALND